MFTTISVTIIFFLLTVDKIDETITSFYIKTVVKDQNVVAKIYPLLLTFGGLPQSGKSAILQHILGRQSKPLSTSSFSQHQLIASGIKSNIRFAEVHTNTIFFYGIQSGFHHNLLMQGRTPAFNSPETATDGAYQLFKDEILTSNVHALYDFLRQNFDKERNQSRMRTLEKVLPSGVAIGNIWELAVSRTILRFLECFRGHLYNNYMWLFLDLNRDIPNLHLPPEGTQGAAMIWRSRLQYLLRSSCLSEDLSSKRVKVCKIFALHDGNHSQVELKAKMLSLYTRCKDAAKQAGLSHLIDFDVIPINQSSSTLQAEFLEKATQLLQQQVQPVNIPISWIFLCSSFQAQKSIFLTHTDLEQKAKECGITQDNLPKFIKLFTSFGYIFDIKLIDKQSEYIIVKPVDFLKRLNVLFKHRDISICTFEVLSLEHAKSRDMFGEEANIFLDVLTSVGLAAKVPSSRLSAVTNFKAPVTTNPSLYYIPFARVGDPITGCRKGAVQMISSMQAPAMNMQIAFASELLDCLSHSVLVPVKEMNVTAIQARPSKDPIEIQIVVQGDVIELIPESNGNNEDMDIVCSSIVKAAHNIALKRAKRGGKVKYHFAVVCANDNHQKISYNIHHRRHILPKEKFCPECSQKDFFVKEILSWNKALLEVCMHIIICVIYIMFQRSICVI